VTADQFRRDARPLVGILAGMPIEVLPHENKSGSYGWHAGGKRYFRVGDEVVEAQVGINITIVGTKPKV